METDKGTLDRTSAYRYAMAWADYIHQNPQLETDSHGNFYGTIGSLAFNFDESAKTLQVLAAAQPHAYGLAKRPDILDELKRISISDPQAVDSARFVLTAGRWQKDQSEPWLYLCLDFKDDSLSQDAFVARVNSLADTAYVWFRVRLAKVADKVNKQQRGVRP